MVNLWISASLLGLTGWQGYRLGREYGWWGRAKVSAPGNNQNEYPPLPQADMEEARPGGLGHSKTDFNWLLTGFTPMSGTIGKTNLPVATEAAIETAPETESADDKPLTEPSTTLMGIAGNGTETLNEYPEETDQIPDSCKWMDDEDEPLGKAGTQEDDQPGERIIGLDDYIKRVKTVQRKMNQLVQKRQSDSGFMKQELGVLIQTYQLDNDQSLDWLFRQHGEAQDTDYGSVFDRIERLAA